MSSSKSDGGFYILAMALIATAVAVAWHFSSKLHPGTSVRMVSNSHRSTTTQPTDEIDPETTEDNPTPEVRQNEPDVDDPLLKQVGSLRSQHKQAQAAELIKSALKERPNDSTLLTEVGVLLIETKAPKEALGYLERVTDAKSTNARAFHFLGRARALTGDRLGAMKAYQRAIDLQPNYVQPCYNLGLLRLQMGDVEKAEKLFVRVTQIDRSRRAAEAYYQLGLIRLKQKHSQEAVTALRECLALRPDYANGWEHLGLALEDMGDLQAALENLERAAHLDVRDYTVQKNLGRLYTKVGRLNDAVESYRAATKIDPRKHEAFAALGAVLLRTGDDAGAMKVYDQALQLAPGYRPALMESGQLCALMGDYPKAEQRLAEYVSADPSSASSRYVLGLVYVARKKWSQALVQLNEVVRLDGDAIMPRVDRVIVMSKLGQAAEAVQASRELLEQDPSRVEARQQLARLLADRGRKTEALTECRLAEKLGPSRPDVMSGAAYVRFKVGAMDEGMLHLQSLLKAELTPEASNQFTGADSQSLNKLLQQAREYLGQHPADHPTLLKLTYGEARGKQWAKSIYYLKEHMILHDEALLAEHLQAAITLPRPTAQPSTTRAGT